MIHNKSPLSVAWINASASTASTSPLGGFAFGGADLPEPQPCLALDMPVLGESGPAGFEVWTGVGGGHFAHQGHISYSHDENCTFGVLRLPEGPQENLVDLTAQAYGEIFALLADLGHRNVWRLWNHFSAINQETAGLERYRQFNVGRQIAFAQASALLQGQMPAASAVGVPGANLAPLGIAFIAGKTPATLIENPHQLSAFHYPEHYGPQSPSFSRAAVVALPQATLLFVSGTASIIGHESVHLDDPLAQTRTALDNVAAVVQEATAASGTAFDLSRMHYRVYVRWACDLAAVQRAVADFFPMPVTVHYVQGDICRRELLVELEAFAHVAVE